MGWFSSITNAVSSVFTSVGSVLAPVISFIPVIGPIISTISLIATAISWLNKPDEPDSRLD